MKFIQFDGSHFAFELSEREKRWFWDVLRQYPLIPSSHHRLSNSGVGPENDSNQTLLEEALAEKKAENRRQLEAMLNEPGRFRRSNSGVRFCLTPHEVEWVLQVLNDVRVGCWVGLGQPGNLNRGSYEITSKNAPYVWAMEICGNFQSMLLAAMEGD